ncbi:AAA family ATPase [Bifidobacterium vansinderenii]|nr:AAA family ATPase [Bifidobacterium vansinderenii]
MTQKDIRDFLKQESCKASELMMMKFPPVKELVTGVIQTGLVLLVAAPKIGKSWLSLHLAYTAAIGGYAFGAIKVDERPVLYLALEDGFRRLQNRLHSLGVTDKGVPDNLEFTVRIPENMSLTEVVGQFLRSNRDKQPLIILDTLGKYKVLSPKRGGETDYERDYRLLGDLQEMVADCDGATMIVVHHTRKAESGDFLDSVSGTNGVAGAADAILKLDRKRGESKGTLQVTSRDGAEGDYLLEFGENGLWTLCGDSLEKAAEAAREYRQTSPVGDMMAEVIRVVNDHSEGVSPKDVAATLGIDDGKARLYLRRALDAGRIRQRKRGVYEPIPAE